LIQNNDYGKSFTKLLKQNSKNLNIIISMYFVNITYNDYGL